MRYTKFLTFTLSCLLLFSLAACGAHDSIGITAENTQAESSPFIGADRALEIAFEMAHATGEEEFTEIHVEEIQKDGKYVYLITFEDSATYYEYDIEATSGKLLRGKRKGKPSNEPFTILLPMPAVSPEPETTAE